MTASDRIQLVGDVYGAYESGDRAVVERNLSDDFIFLSHDGPTPERAPVFASLIRDFARRNSQT